MLTSTNIAKFERFFRLAAGLDIDKKDLDRLAEFVNATIRNLIVRAEAIAKANMRNVIEPYDLPVREGFEDRVNEFRKLDEALGLEAEFDRLVKRPPTDLDYSEDTERKLVSVAGGLSLALAGSFKVIDPEVKNPSSRHWEQAYALYDLVL